MMNFKYRALLMAIYSARLHVSEVARLKVTDIDTIAPLQGMRIRADWRLPPPVG